MKSRLATSALTRRAALLAALACPLPARSQSMVNLHDAARRGDAQALRRALASGASPDPRDAQGRTPLLIATIGNHPDAARALIEAGADVNAQADNRDSPFLYAGAEGRNEILRLTLPKADLKSTNRYDGTALIPACHHGHVETVKLLLATGIDRDHVNRLGWTALLEAVILGDGSATYDAIIGLLLDARANPNIPDRDGVSPLAHARARGFQSIARRIAAAGGR